MNPFSDFSGAGVLAVLLLFVAFLALFARRGTGWVLLGFFRIVQALFLEPFGYLSRTIGRFMGVGKAGLKGVMGAQRGLLSTFLFYLQMLVAVGAIGILAGGTFLAWKVLQPSASSERYLGLARTELAQTKQNLESSQLTLKGIEGNIVQKKSELVNAFRAERQKAIQTADQEMPVAEKAVQKDAVLLDALGKIKTFLADKGTPTNTWEPNSAKEKVDSFISNTVSVDYAAKAPLQTYIDQWHKKMVAQVELATFDEGQITRQMERERQELTQRVASLDADFKGQTRVVAQAEEAASFRFGAAFLALLLTFGQFVGFIWALGLLLELFEKGLQVSAHVAEIRNHLVEAAPIAKSLEPSPTDGAGAGLDPEATPAP